MAEFELLSPAAELAQVLQRAHADLEAAARAGAESRVQGLRALAEQAVLAVELENVLERDPAWRGDATLRRLYATLRGLQERMLGQIAATGLEVIRLRGASAGSVRDVIEVESWRYDEAYAGEVVVDELEVAVRLDGRPVRMGRVVMGAPAGAASQVQAPAERSATPQAAPAAPTASPALSRPARPDGHIVCPVPGCGAENDTGTEVCVGCLTPLSGYIRLLLHPHALFNRGLRAARAGDSRAARDCFAAVVLWQPEDVAPRNAYALACLSAGDRTAARRAWEQVLERSPRDAIAARGLTALARAAVSSGG